MNTGAKKQAKKRLRYKWGTFICHVTADKKGFVTPLAKELEKFGVKVWLDDFILRVGDSLQTKNRRRSVEIALWGGRVQPFILSEEMAASRA
jgi:hypothetical protein